MAAKIAICKLCHRRPAAPNVFFKYTPRCIEQEICSICINRVLDLHRLEREWREQNINWYLRIPKLAYSVQSPETKNFAQLSNYWFDQKTNEDASDDDYNSGNELEKKLIVPIEERFNLKFRLTPPKSQSNVKEMTDLSEVASGGDNVEGEMKDIAQSEEKLKLTLPENFNVNLCSTKSEPKSVTDAIMIDAAIAITAEDNGDIEIDEHHPKKSEPKSSEKCNMDYMLEKTIT